MYKNKVLLIITFFFAVIASSSVYAGDLELNTFVDQSPATITLPANQLLMATIETTANSGGAQAVDTIVSFGGAVVAADIAEVCVDYGGGVPSCLAVTGSLTNISIPAPSGSKGGAPFNFSVTLNSSAAGKTILLTVEEITVGGGKSAVVDNIGLPANGSTQTRNIQGASAEPSVTTNAATNPVHAPNGGAIGEITIGGNVSASDPALTEVGVYWSTSSGFTPPGQGTQVIITPLPTPPSDFSDTLTGLNPGVYYFRAYAANSVGTAYASELSFSIQSLPTLLSDPVASNIQPTSADLSGTMTDDGFDNISDCGVEWRVDTGTYGDGNSGSASFGVCNIGNEFTLNTGTTLTTGTTYFYRSYATNSLGTGYSANEGSFKPVDRPTVTTGGATPSQTEATLAGTVTNNGGDTLSNCSIKWSQTSDTAAPYTYTNSASAGACTENIEFTVLASNLSPGTTYFYRAFATNGAGEEPASNESSFPTDPGVATMVATPTVEAVGVVSGEATLGGELSATGGGTISDCGIAWGASDLSEPYSYPNSASLGSACSIGTPYTVDATGLTNGTTYYFRSWATNESGTSYSSSEGNFVPYTTPSSTTGDYAGVTQNQATLAATVTNDGGSTITDCGVEWRISTGAYGDANSGSTSYGICSVNVEYTVLATGLNPGVTYFYRAFANTALSVETPAESELQFTTSAGLATVATLTPENLTKTTADLGGDVTANGGVIITDRGVVWNTTNTWNTANPPATSGGTQVSIGSGTGPFIGTVTYSPPEAESALIYFRAYATNSEGTAYSSVQSFQYVSGQPKDINISRVTAKAIVFSWTPGLGEGSLVVIRETATADVLPQDGYDYLVLPPYPNPDFSLPPPELNEGTATGNYVAYQGSGTSLWLNGLTPGTSYTVTLYDYTGTTFRLDEPAQFIQLTTNELVHNYDNRANCTDCHNTHIDFLARGPVLGDACTSACHVPGGPAENKIGFTSDTSISVAGHPTPGQNPNVDFVDCGSCHELHNPDSYNTTQSTHPVTGVVAFNKAFLRANVDKYAPNATTPANLHGGDDTLDNTDIPKVMDGDTEIVPADTPNRAIEGGNENTARGYCQVCHTYTKYHRATGTTTGQLLPDGSTSTAHSGWSGRELTNGGYPECHDGMNNDTCGEGGAAPMASTVTLADLTNASLTGPQAHCGDCHQHNNNFAGVGGNTSCVVCHAPDGGGTIGTNSRPAITTQFDRFSKHLQDGSANLDPADCEVCHEQSTHNRSAMVVRGKDLDSAGAFYSQPTAGAQPTATGEGEALEGHCLSCHDSDGASALGGSSDAPFSGTAAGKLATLDDIGANWATAGHNRDSATYPDNPVTCLGDGTNGCHASGHATESPSLLASWDGVDPLNSATNTPLTPTEFCLVCHDADGPSSIDVDAAFPAGITANTVNCDPDPNDGTVTGTGTPCNFQTVSASGAAVNQRHDVLTEDQTYSAGSVSCAACHNPHADNATNPVTNPDTGAGLGTYVASNYGTGNDPTFGAGGPDMIEFCLACHDGAGGSTQAGGSVLSPSLRNIAVDYATDFHGEGFGSTAGNGFLKAPYAVDVEYAAMQCTTCHGAHGSPNIFNLKSSITVNGTVMEVGGWTGDTMGEVIGDGPPGAENTVYYLPRIDGRNIIDASGAQADHNWGAWCSFCHNLQTHGKDEDITCSGGHMHGGGQKF